MKEIYIIYGKTTGLIEGTGRLDRQWDKNHKDGSTASELIEKLLRDNSDLKVVYLPNQKLPDHSQYKVSKNGTVVEMTDQEKTDWSTDQATSINLVEKIQELEDKIEALKNA